MYCVKMSTFTVFLFFVCQNIAHIIGRDEAVMVPIVRSKTGASVYIWVHSCVHCVDNQVACNLTHSLMVMEISKTVISDCIKAS